jgi:hypothetical protein
MTPADKILKVIGFTAMGLIVIVTGVIVIHWAVGFVQWSGLDSGWAQFIGAIAALAVAIYLGDRQHKNSMELLLRTDRLALEGRLSSVLAVLDEAVIRVQYVKNITLGEGYFAHLRENLSATMQGTNLDVAMLYAGLSAFVGRPQFGELIEAIDRIPMHELGHSNMVSALFTVRNALRVYDQSLLSFTARLDELSANNASVAASAWNAANVGFSLVSAGRDQFASAMAELFAAG